MTPKFSLITAVAALTFVLAVPTAWGKGQLGSQTASYPDVVDRAVAARQTEGRTLVFDDHRTGIELGQNPGTYPDVVARAVAARQTAGRSLVFDNYRIDGPPAQSPGPAQITVTRSEGGVEWPQVGIGFGLGLVLALGLGLAMRFAHSRPLAH
jgi:hypothetical protein